MEASSVSFHSTDELIEEVLKRSVAGYVVLYAYDSKSGEAFKYEDWKGDPSMLVGPLTEALEECIPCNPIWEGEIEEEEIEEDDDEEDV